MKLDEIAGVNTISLDEKAGIQALERIAADLPVTSTLSREAGG